ncbi:helix-turn-helix domain-containing protein [Novosphingobium sp. BW1]|uniref:helix-turn-helix domain-containing protein n=1 Tax=Novosphingobium sp. BW1 TaxID=2592621 RepID=UPI0011DE605C|nr:helix-turn-helix domain-containing protein [Novosphingobium sp. BW1]TYC83795.1 hypothetical protein FMM79_19180 [Novosphingobium sp. BW1]
MTSSEHDHAEMGQAEQEVGQMIWLRAAPRMTRLATIVIRLRLYRGWSPERICRRLHISRRRFRRHLLIAVREIARAAADIDR